MDEAGGWRRSSMCNGGECAETREWKRASKCNSGECAEVAMCSDGHVEVRNSRYPEEFLAFTQAEWTAFEAGMKAGEFGVEVLAGRKPLDFRGAGGA